MSCRRFRQSAFSGSQRAAWVCVMVERHPSIQYKVAWEASAIVLSPIACPFVYFTILRPKEHNQRRAAAVSSLAGSH